MTNHQDRRERIAAQVLAAIYAAGDTGSEWYAKDAKTAVGAADALIAELDRAAPQQMESNHPGSPEGWVVWDDSDAERPIHDRHMWLGLGVDPYESREEAEAYRRQYKDYKLRVRRWPLDPAEDKPEVKP